MADPAKIAVKLNELKGVSGRLQEVMYSLNNIENAIQNIVDQTDPIWVGKARNQYAVNCKQVRKRIQKMGDQVTERKTTLEAAITTYEKTEGKVVSNVQNLSADNIF